MNKSVLAVVAYAAAMIPDAPLKEAIGEQVWLTNPAGELLFDESGAAVFVEAEPDQTVAS